MGKLHPIHIKCTKKTWKNNIYYPYFVTYCDSSLTAWCRPPNSNAYIPARYVVTEQINPPIFCWLCQYLLNSWCHLQHPPLIFFSVLLWWMAPPSHGSMPRRTARNTIQTWPECATSWKMSSSRGWWTTTQCGSGWGWCPGCGPMGVNPPSHPGIDCYSKSKTEVATVVRLMSAAAFMGWSKRTVVTKQPFSATVVNSFTVALYISE